MSEHEDDQLPLGALRDAWSNLRPAAGDKPDVRDQAVASWMRAAWRQLEAPAPDPARLLRQRARRERRVILEWAVAASLLFAGIAFAVQRSMPAARSNTESAAISAGASTTRPYLATVAPDRLELRSGPVRLILLTNDSTAVNDAATGEDR